MQDAKQTLTRLDCYIKACLQPHQPIPLYFFLPLSSFLFKHILQPPHKCYPSCACTLWLLASTSPSNHTFLPVLCSQGFSLFRFSAVCFDCLFPSGFWETLASLQICMYWVYWCAVNNNDAVNNRTCRNRRNSFYVYFPESLPIILWDSHDMSGGLILEWLPWEYIVTTRLVRPQRSFPTTSFARRLYHAIQTPSSKDSWKFQKAWSAYLASHDPRREPAEDLSCCSADPLYVRGDYKSIPVGGILYSTVQCWFVFPRFVPTKYLYSSSSCACT